MRVFYINSGLQGCYYYRCFQPMQENGWDGDQTTMILDQQMKTPEDKARAAQMADVVVFHRPDDPDKLKLARLLKKAGKKIVFDNDDTYKDDGGFKINEFMDKERMEKGMKSINEVIDDFIKEADMVTTSTEYLAEEYRKLNPVVEVLPNFIDPLYFDEPIRNTTDKLRIGVTGSIGATTDFDVAMDIINKTIDDEELQWVFFSLPKHNFAKIARELYNDEINEVEELEKKGKLEWHGFVEFPVYHDTLNSLALDVMAIPRADTYFNHCKSNIKFLEASMFEIPVIAQGFPDGLSPYQVDKEDAEHMIICNNTEEFLAAIEKMKDKEFRLSMGKKAREYVEDKYDISNHGDLWVKAYQKLFKNQTL